MVNIRSSEEIEILRKAGHINYLLQCELEKYIKVGITTKELDEIAYKFIIEHEAIPSFLNFEGFPASICASLNDEVVHGIPDNRILQSGDLLKIDVGVKYQGYHSDSARTYIIGEVNEDVRALVENTEKALYKGIAEVKEDVKLGDIGASIADFAKENKLSVVRELVGHGVGTELHEDPDVPNYGHRGLGMRLKAGMVIAIEPMLNLGKKEICILDNGWTIATLDGSPSAHFEHTVLVTKDGFEILTGEKNG